MEITYKKGAPALQSESSLYRVSPFTMKLMLYAPVLILLVFTITWFTPSIHKYAAWISKENRPVEILTFIFLFAGSILGVLLTKWMKAKNKKPILWIFFSFLSVGLFVIAMEEISWGQQFLKFETPESLRNINQQDELTLHNIEGLHGNSEYFHLFFGLAGLIGIWANLYFLNEVRVPKMLTTWFLAITVTAIFDLTNDFIQYEYLIGYFTRRLSEVNEMLIGFAAFAYVVLLTRKFKNEHIQPVNSISKKERIFIK